MAIHNSQTSPVGNLPYGMMVSRNQTFESGNETWVMWNFVFCYLPQNHFVLTLWLYLLVLSGTLYKVPGSVKRAMYLTV